MTKNKYERMKNRQLMEWVIDNSDERHTPENYMGSGDDSHKEWLLAKLALDERLQEWLIIDEELEDISDAQILLIAKKRGLLNLRNVQ
jgi:hypothetical protein